jgi:acyl-CoA synthetase (AMP-forming)/AMP-acid ligase II
VDFDYAAHGLVAPRRRPRIPGGGPQTAAEVLDAGLAEHPDREALVGRHGRLRWAELDAAANRAAAALDELGVGPGDRVAAALPNDVDLAIVFLACMRRAAIWVGVNRVLAPPEKTYVLEDSGAGVLLATPDVAAELEMARRSDGLASLRHVVCVDPGDRASDWARRLSRPIPTPRRRSPTPAARPAFPRAPSTASTTCCCPVPCRASAPRTHPAFATAWCCRSRSSTWSCWDRSRAGSWSCCVAIDRIDPVGLAGWIRDERVGHFAGVPTILHDLLSHPDVKPTDLEPLVLPMVGGAECPEEFRDLYRERFGREVGIGYGMTEAPTAVTHAAGEPSPRPGLCGVALPQVEIEIRGKDDRPLPTGEIGEICVRPARSGDWADVYTPMLGYWNQPEATRDALRGGAYHSGDLGFLEADGSLFIRGRRSELILRGGANVYPAEVERALQQDRRVAGCAVLGVPDARLGERVVAAVELEPGARAEPDELIALCRERLARYKVPERIVVLDALPRNAMAKVIVRELRPLFDSEARRS